MVNKPVTEELAPGMIDGEKLPLNSSINLQLDNGQEMVTPSNRSLFRMVKSAL